jgi:hypothetical protein
MYCYLPTKTHKEHIPLFVPHQNTEMRARLFVPDLKVKFNTGAEIALASRRTVAVISLPADHVTATRKTGEKFM